SLSTKASITRTGLSSSTQSSRHSGNSVAWPRSIPSTKRLIRSLRQKAAESYSANQITKCVFTQPGSITDTIGRRKDLFPLSSALAPLDEDSWLRLNRRRNKQPTNVISSDESLNLGYDDVHQREACTLRCRRAWQYFGCSNGSSTSDDPPDRVDRSAPGIKERPWGRQLRASTGAKHARERRILRSEPGAIQRIHLLRLGAADSLDLECKESSGFPLSAQHQMYRSRLFHRSQARRCRSMRSKFRKSPESRAAPKHKSPLRRRRSLMFPRAGFIMQIS